MVKKFNNKINPRKDLPDGKFEKYVMGDDIQYEIVGENEKLPLWLESASCY